MEIKLDPDGVKAAIIAVFGVIAFIFLMVFFPIVVVALFLIAAIIMLFALITSFAYTVGKELAQDRRNRERRNNNY